MKTLNYLIFALLLWIILPACQRGVSSSFDPELRPAKPFFEADTVRLGPENDYFAEVALQNLGDEDLDWQFFLEGGIASLSPRTGKNNSLIDFRADVSDALPDTLFFNGRLETNVGSDSFVVQVAIPAPPIEQGKARVFITSYPRDGFSVLMDGFTLNDTPLSEELDPGTYTFRVYDPHGAYLPADTTVTLIDGQTFSWNVTLIENVAFLQITSSPTQATYFINGERAGLTGFAEVKVRPGDYTITVIKVGYIPLSLNVSSLTLHEHRHIHFELVKEEEPDLTNPDSVIVGVGTLYDDKVVLFRDGYKYVDFEPITLSWGPWAGSEIQPIGGHGSEFTCNSSDTAYTTDSVHFTRLKFVRVGDDSMDVYFEAIFSGNDPRQLREDAAIGFKVSGRVVYALRPGQSCPVVRDVPGDVGAKWRYAGRVGA